MYRFLFLVMIAMMQFIPPASAERIKRKPPDEATLARLASDQVINDGGLRRGDIISTDRGFFQLRGLKADGSYDFVSIANPKR